MRVLSSAMAALVVASASAQVLPWVPGVCVDMGATTSVGLGCGVVGTTLDAYKPINTTQYKIRPVVQVQPCLPQCYTPGHATGACVRARARPLRPVRPPSSPRARSDAWRLCVRA